MAEEMFPSEFPEYYRPLSLRLYNLLEDLGATVDMRKVRMEACATREILRTIVFQPHLTSYIFGSSYEGTTLPGMRADLDEVALSNKIKVVTKTRRRPGSYLLLIQDQTTPAGYCKLQLMHDGISNFRGLSGQADELFSEIFSQSLMTSCIDNDGRTVCCFKPSSYLGRKYLERHGPALSISESDTSSGKDIVWALQCSELPDCISEWLYRQRRFNWPTSQMIESCKMFGCLFVPVGHHHSDEQNIQWRISPSHQERFLVSKFNSVQLKCYIVLKLIKTELIASYSPDTLSSYHIKTCMLYMIENTPSTFWKPENLLHCVVVCLKRILKWVNDGNCPNYFIPSENMFERHVYGEKRQKLLRYLQYLLSLDCKFLVKLHTHELGDLLYYSFLHLNYEIKPEYRRTVNILLRCRQIHINYAVLMTCVKSYHTSLMNDSDEDLEKCLIFMYRSISSLRQTERISDHTKDETTRAISLLLPYKELSFMSNLIAFATKQRKSNDQIYSYLTSETWQNLCLTSDSFSSKLKQASLLYVLGYSEEAIAVLETLKGLNRHTVCFCYNNGNTFVGPDMDALFEAVIETTNITVESLMKCAVVPCIYFLPTEKDVTPTAISYEMIRTIGIDTPSEDDLENLDKHCSEWAVVDGQFLLHFLLFLNHHRLNNQSFADADIINMESLVNLKNISHRETCLNLLGWVFKEQEDTDRAKECFKSSLEVKPSCNAAFWHMKDLECMTVL